MLSELLNNPLLENYFETGDSIDQTLADLVDSLSDQVDETLNN